MLLRNSCIYWLKRLAGSVGNRSNRLSLKSKKLLLLCLVLVGGLYCFYHVISIFDNNEEYTSYSVTPISIPQFIRNNGDEAINEQPLISKKEFERIHRFHLYMDSLAKDSSGRARYDSIVRNHPGLLDSIIIIENIFQSQLKK